MTRDLKNYPALQAWNAHAQQLADEVTELQSISNTNFGTTLSQQGQPLDFRIYEQTLHAKIAIIKGLASQVPDLLEAARVDQLRAWDADLKVRE